MSAAAGWGAGLVDAARAAGPPLLFGLRLWASVCLALYVAFWLQLDNAYWAGTSAAIVCQPQLGASMRKALVPHDRHHRRRGHDRGAERVLSARSLRLSRRFWRCGSSSALSPPR